SRETVWSAQTGGQPGHRIDRVPIQPYLEMEVGAGGRAGGSNQPDDLAAFDLLSNRDQDLRLVRVARREPLSLVDPVVDAGVVAVAAVPSRPEHVAGLDRPDRRPARGREVHPGVELPKLVERVEPHAEVAGLPSVDRH